MSHTCHAFECNTRIPQKMFMCKKHWYMLSRPQRIKIWRLYTPNQEKGLGITDAYGEHAKACIRSIAEKERKTIPEDDPCLRVYDLTERIQ